MWVVMFSNDKNMVVHMICTKNEPTGVEIMAFSKELLEDPEFNYAADDIKNVDIKEIDVDYDEYVNYVKKH